MKTEPQYQDLKFKSPEEFESWLKSTTKFEITFEDDGQDFSKWHLDEHGEVLHSDFQAFIWNGKMVDIENIKEGEFLPLQDGLVLTHNVEKITQSKSEAKKK